MSYVTISLWNATEWSDEMEALAREKYVPLVMSMGASSVKMVQTGELSFAVITTTIAKRPQRQHNSVLLRSGRKQLRKCL